MTPYAVNVKINLDQAGDSDNDVLVDEESDGIPPTFPFFLPSPPPSLLLLISGDSKSNTGLLVRGNKLNTRKALTFYSYSNFSLDLSYAQADLLPAGSKYVSSYILFLYTSLSTLKVLILNIDLLKQNSRYYLLIGNTLSLSTFSSPSSPLPLLFSLSGWTSHTSQ